MLISGDEADAKWLETFIGQSIEEGSTIEGFVSVISYMNPDGDMCWRTYCTIDNGMRAVGLLTTAATQLSVEMSTSKDDE